ncbi:MAG: RNA-binding protein [Candidatus Latescibacterota bacterium]|jgi:RNA recognition motif-containing protein
MDIFVGNIPYQATADELRALFEPYGQVASASVITDRDTGRSRGFGFVSMPDPVTGSAAIEALNGHDWLGRPLKVNQAHPRSPGRSGGPADT